MLCLINARIARDQRVLFTAQCCSPHASVHNLLPVWRITNFQWKLAKNKNEKEREKKKWRHENCWDCLHVCSFGIRDSLNKSGSKVRVICKWQVPNGNWNNKLSPGNRIYGVGKFEFDLANLACLGTFEMCQRFSLPEIFSKLQQLPLIHIANRQNRIYRCNLNESTAVDCVLGSANAEPCVHVLMSFATKKHQMPARLNSTSSSVCGKNLESFTYTVKKSTTQFWLKNTILKCTNHGPEKPH